MSSRSLIHVSRPTLLIVESDHNLCQIIEVMLRQDGYNVVRAYNSTEALEVIPQHRFIGVVIGTLMSGLSGIELCRTLRRQPETAKLPVLIMLSTPDQTNIGRAIAAGANAYLVKPVLANDLQAKVRQMLR
jgi:twitching motility two-component system response regulator PilH